MRQQYSWGSNCRFFCARNRGGSGDFEGTARRFETKGEAGQIRVIDDYAHHPTEVEALMHQAREAAGGGRVLVLFQPHLYSRTRNFASRFAQALDLADQVVVCDIFRAREDPIAGVTSHLITDKMRRGSYLGIGMRRRASSLIRLSPGI